MMTTNWKNDVELEHSEFRQRIRRNCMFHTDDGKLEGRKSRGYTVFTSYMYPGTANYVYLSALVERQSTVQSPLIH